MQKTSFLILGFLILSILVLKGLDFSLEKTWKNPYQFLDKPSTQIPLYPKGLKVKIQLPSIFQSPLKNRTVLIQTNEWRSLNQTQKSDYPAIAIGSMTTSNELVEENRRWPNLLEGKTYNFGYRGTGFALAKNTVKYILEKTPIRPKTIYLLSALTDIRCFLEDNCESEIKDSFLERIQVKGERFVLGEAIGKSALYSFLSYQWNHFWGYPLEDSALVSVPQNEKEVPENLFQELGKEIDQQLLPKRKIWLKQILEQKPAETQLILLTQPNAYQIPLNSGEIDLRNRPIFRRSGLKYVFTPLQISQWIDKVNEQTKVLAQAFKNENVQFIDTDVCVMKQTPAQSVYWKGQFSPQGNLVFAHCINSEAHKNKPPPDSN